MFKLKIDETKVGRSDSSFKLDRISPSAMGSYLGCPLSFYYKYIAKVKMPEENLHLLFGSGIHKAIEDMYNGEKDPIKSFHELFVGDKLDAKSKERYFEFSLLGEEMVKNYMQLHPLLDSMYGLSDGQSELRFKMPIVNPVSEELSSVPLSGIVDRFISSGKIIEYKTSANKWSPDERRFKIQSRLYSLWYFTNSKEMIDEGIYIILLKKYKKTERDKVHQIISYKPTKEDLAEFWEEMELVLEKIEAGIFERPKKGHPPYCDCYKFEAFLGISD